MALSNTVFSTILQGIITSKTPALKLKLEGGLSPIRKDFFSSDDYKNEDLIEPADGIYLVQKNMDEWIKSEAFPPGEDQDKIKKLMWKKFSDELAGQLTSQITNWLRDDVMPEFATAINSQIKMADITITVPPTSVLVPVPPPALTAPTITGTPIPPTNIVIT